MESMENETHDDEKFCYGKRVIRTLGILMILVIIANLILFGSLLDQTAQLRAKVDNHETQIGSLIQKQNFQIPLPAYVPMCICTINTEKYPELN